jgi:hypothetical protein
VIFEPNIIDAKEAVYQMLMTEYERIRQQYIGTDLRLDVIVRTSYPQTEVRLDSGTTTPSNLFEGSRAQISISRVSDRTESNYIGRAIGASSVVSPGDIGYYPASEGQTENKWVSPLGKMCTDIIEIRIWTLEPQFRDELYKLTKQIIFQKFPQVMEQFGIMNIDQVGGTDGEVSAQWLPRMLFIASINMAVMYPLIEMDIDDLVTAISVPSSGVSLYTEGFSI